MDLIKLKQYLEICGQPNFRYRQIEEAYFSGKYNCFDQLSNISKELRNKLNSMFKFETIVGSKILKSHDSLKAKLELEDGNCIETVLMKYKDFNSVCVSCQVGCAMGCKFCATGKMGFKRNLNHLEIIDQVLFWRHLGYDTDRIVYMGMGEPFLNWKEVEQSIILIHDRLNIGWRKISISTAGIRDGINKFTKFNKEVNLAISIHSLDQKVRKSIMPGAGKYPLDLLLADIDRYVAIRKRQVFFEYALINGVNDNLGDAVKLAKFVNSNKLYYLNLINLNPVAGNSLKPSFKINDFVKILDKYRVKYSVRRSLGRDIQGACGQLIINSKS